MIPSCGNEWLGMLGTNRVEIEEPFAPCSVHIVQIPLHRNVFAGVAKSNAPASIGEQEEKL
jgi:hypothetical protein